MGMQSEVFFRATLRSTTPELVIDVLSRMISDGEPVAVPDGPLFEGTLWMHMFRRVGHQFPATTMNTLRLDGRGWWHFAALSSFKNYGNEFEHFCDWIAPFVDDVDGAFLGYRRDELADGPEAVHLCRGGTVIWADMVAPPHP